MKRHELNEKEKAFVAAKAAEIAALQSRLNGGLEMICSQNDLVGNWKLSQDNAALLQDEGSSAPQDLQQAPDKSGRP